MLRTFLNSLKRLLPLTAACVSGLLPSICALCGNTGRDPLCAACRLRHFPAGRSRCDRCAEPLPRIAANSGTGSNAVCGRCLREPPAFDATIAATDYAPPFDSLVLALKFGGELALAPAFAGMLEVRIRGRQSLPHADHPLPDILTAVPLGRQRLRERGFNQALELARPLSRACGIPLDAGLLVRVRETRPQSTLHPDERNRNVRGAFAVPAEAVERVRGKHVGLVDDVMTTGETLGEIAAMLKRFGATRVTCLVFARTLP